MVTVYAADGETEQLLPQMNGKSGNRTEGGLE